MPALAVLPPLLRYLWHRAQYRHGAFLKDGHILFRDDVLRRALDPHERPSNMEALAHS